MSLLTSRRSSSSFRSTALYSSSYRAEDSMDPLFGTYMDSAEHPSLFLEEGPGGPKCSSPYSWLNRSSFGNSVSLGSSLMGRPSSISSPGAAGGGGGGARCRGDMYFVSVDVSQFEPQDVVVMAYHQHVVIQAAKVLDDGRVGDTFTHKSLLPEDMDPLSVSGTVGSDGLLVVSVSRKCSLQMEPPGPCSPQGD
ncbi:heat shock protein beta-7-like [Boleophthalmus pectinirostris]|uniref:heat shock protein beta-7-like n=1 Tax=Boleophthalmus pectinirostris TaxID=150288 RepID=UPI0024318C49|nr:heat shock protein beta-7-like [Boleophthalmus pectinirostris]